MSRAKALAVLASNAMTEGYLIYYEVGKTLVCSERAFDNDTVTIARQGNDDHRAQTFVAVRTGDGYWRYST
jgi:hypothetical protein